MNTKERLNALMESKFGGGSLTSLLAVCVDKIPLKDILYLRNHLIDDNFVSLMEDGDMASCIEEFFKYNLNVAETSRNSFLHRNTLLYRLNKIHSITGLNIRNFDDAVAFKILTKVYKLTI